MKYKQADESSLAAIKKNIMQQADNDIELTNIILVSILIEIIKQNAQQYGLYAPEFNLEEQISEILQQYQIDNSFIENVKQQIYTNFSNADFRQDLSKAIANEIKILDDGINEDTQLKIHKDSPAFIKQGATLYDNYQKYLRCEQREETLKNLNLFNIYVWPMHIAGAVGAVLGSLIGGPGGAFVGCLLGAAVGYMIMNLIVLEVREVNDLYSIEVRDSFRFNSNFGNFFTSKKHICNSPKEFSEDQQAQTPYTPYCTA